MRRFAGLLLCWLAWLSTPAAARDSTPTTVPPVVALRIDGAISPAAADQVRLALDRAARGGAQLVVLQMDTPGGLDSAMRNIIKDILGSPVPVVGFVSPQGARAASAGTYILYATHVAAMAPATNLGAATPIAIGLPFPGAGADPARPPDSGAAKSAASQDSITAKRVNDATAYIRSLAQLRGRNADWAEEAVRDSVSLAASDALARRVIDLVAVDLNDLLRQLDGRVVTLGGSNGRSVTLATAQAAVLASEPDARGRLLAVISDPSVALLLMLIGIYGLLFEFMNPGFIAPGVIGGVCLLLALWGLQMLPISYAGLALILLAIAFFIGEAFMPSFGALGLGGVVAFAFGALLLIDSDVPGLGIPLPLIGALAALSAGFVIGVVGMAAKARRRPVVSGTPWLLGAPAEIIEFAAGQGWATVEGERWKVRAAQPLRPGQAVRVTGVDGLILDVSAGTDAAPAQGVSR